MLSSPPQPSDNSRHTSRHDVAQPRGHRLNIGDLKLDHNVVLAPMSGVTDQPFRKMVRQLGGGLVVSEMVASHAVLSEVKTEMRKLRISAREESPLSIQLAGWDPQMMAEAAKVAAGLGADLIDINMGCPAKKVTGRLSGSALMQDLPLAGQICEAVVKAVDRPVTLKMRLGWDADHKNAPELAHIAEEAGIQMLVVHGRTRTQMYKGEADWQAVAQSVAAVSLPVLVNGDIKSPEDARQALALSTADGVMVGRGAQGKPWLIREIAQSLQGAEITPAPKGAALKTLILDHLEAMLSHYGTHGLRLARKHIGWYADGVPGAAAFRQMANNSNDADKVFAAIEHFFDESDQMASDLSDTPLSSLPSSDVCARQDAA